MAFKVKVLIMVDGSVFVAGLVFSVEKVPVAGEHISMLLFALQLSSKTNLSWSLR